MQKSAKKYVVMHEIHKKNAHPNVVSLKNCSFTRIILTKLNVLQKNIPDLHGFNWTGTNMYKTDSELVAVSTIKS